MLMLRESSTTTAIMFCCELSSATRIAGCHSKNRTRATNADCIPQTTQARQFRTSGAAFRSFQRISRASPTAAEVRSEEHTSELQSLRHLVCRLLLEKKK